MASHSERPAGRASHGPSNVDQLGGDRREDIHPRPGRPLPVLIASIPKGDGEVRVTLDEFKGNLTVDVRLFEAFSAAAVPMPTRKGVTLGLAKLPDLARALAQAEATARTMGLLS